MISPLWKPSLVLLVLLGAAAQAPIEPPEYPDGQMCSPRGDVHYVPGIGWRSLNDHACKCHRVDQSEDCDSVPIEDKVCLQFCHHDNCSCPIECSVKGHAN